MRSITTAAKTRINSTLPSSEGWKVERKLDPAVRAAGRLGKDEDGADRHDQGGVDAHAELAEAGVVHAGDSSISATPSTA